MEGYVLPGKIVPKLFIIYLFIYLCGLFIYVDFFWLVFSIILNFHADLSIIYLFIYL